MITLPNRDTLSPLERYGLDLLVDLSRCPEVENGSDVVRLEITERDPGGGVEDLRACAAHHWHIERGDAVVQIARAVLRRLGEIATGAAEQRSSARDRFGRVPSTENVLVQQSLVAEPVVARAAAELRKAVVDSAGRRPVALLAPWPDGRRWAAAITHDLDVVDRWPVFTALRLAELARKGELRRVARTLGSALTAIGRSPIQSALRVLLADERARGIVSTWFVLCGTPTREHGCEINLHGSFVTSEHHEVFAEQRGRLARLTEQPVLGVRQHFLRMRPGITSRGMAEAGFRYDTTWGFPDQNGFRLGVGDVIPAWDGEGERALELLEAPVIWMDRALSKYAGVEDSAAWITEGMSLARTCRDVEGLWVGVWHPNLTDALGFPDAPAAFAKLLDELVAEEPFMAPLGRLIEWRVARRAVRVRGILPDGRPDAYTDAPAPSHDTLTLADASGARRYSIPAMPR